MCAVVRHAPPLRQRRPIWVAVRHELSGSLLLLARPDKSVGDFVGTGDESPVMVSSGATADATATSVIAFSALRGGDGRCDDARCGWCGGAEKSDRVESCRKWGVGACRVR